MSYPLNYYQHFLETLKPNTHTHTHTHTHCRGRGRGERIFLNGDKAVEFFTSCSVLTASMGLRSSVHVSINNDVKFSCTSLIK